MTPLSTRSRCDLCGLPASVAVDPHIFLCAGCAEYDPDSEVPCETGSAPAVSSLAPSLACGAAGAINSGIPCDASRWQQGPGPSSVTGRSVDRPNAGGEHEEVAPLELNRDEKSAACESTSLIAADEFVDTCRTGTGPGASGPERDFFGAAHSNSGDVLGNLEPGSHTWGERAALTAPSGRADESATCPDVAGTLSDPSPGFLLPSGPSATCALAPAITASAPFPSEIPAGPSPWNITAAAGFQQMSAAVDPASNLDFENEVAALEAEWLARGICMNAKTFFVAAASEIADISKSVSAGA